MDKKRKLAIPLSKPWFGEEEKKAALKSIKSLQIEGDGAFGQQLEKKMAKYLKANYVLLVTSCTSALELALMTSNIGSGDEVIVPSFTFVSTANAVVRQGAKPVFVDICKNTYNINPEEIKKAITSRTRAIIPVHYAGVGCEMDEIMKIARKHKLLVIEDAAHAIGSKYNGSYLGTIGDVGCFSFHKTKLISCGEGGAFVTNNKKIAYKAFIMREKGTNRKAFIAGKVNKYRWVDKGSSLVLSDILASIALVQFKKLPQIIKCLKNHASYLTASFKELSDKIILPCIPAESNHSIYPIRISKLFRDKFINLMRNKGIEASFHFLPLHLAPYAGRFKNKKSNLPVTEEVCETLVRLPMYPELTKKELNCIVGEVKKAVEILI